MEKAPILVMGVSGSGKSTVGARLAETLSLPFVDSDELHSAANRKKMAAGIPLSDQDREPWLDAVAEVLARGGVVVACSALRRRYRDRLRMAAPRLRLIYLSGSAALLAQRLAGRSHPFMPAKLLASQLAVLEPPDPDEQALVLDIAVAPAQIVSRAAAWFAHH